MQHDNFNILRFGDMKIEIYKHFDTILGYFFDIYLLYKKSILSSPGVSTGRFAAAQVYYLCY